MPTDAIGIGWHSIGLCQKFMILWQMREHQAEHLYGEKQNQVTKNLTVQIQEYWHTG